MQDLMKQAWVFGVLGLACLLGFLALGFLTLLGADVSPYLQIAGVASGVLLIAYGVLDREAVTRGVSSRSFLYGAGALVLVLVVGVIGVMAYAVVEKHDEQWDWTRDKQFSVSDKSVKVVEGLERSVDVFAFFRGDSGDRASFDRMFEQLVQHTDKLSLQHFDPLLNPRMADAYTVTSDYGTVILVSGDDRQRLETDFTEEAFVNALIRLTSTEDHRICWAMGHGESDPDDDRGPEGLGVVVVKLEDQNYTFTKSNVLTTGIEAECEALVVAAPKRDWLPIERERLAVYLAQGGSVFMMLEPDTVPMLAEELHRYAVIVGDDIVLEVDPGHQLADIQDPVVIALTERDYAIHPITSSLDSITVLMTARSVRADPLVQGFRTHELLQASKDSWGETTLDIDPANPTANPDAFFPNEGVDLKGPVSLMVAVEVTDPAAIGVAVAPVPAPVPTDTDGVDAPAAPALGAGFGLQDVSKAVPADFSPVPGGRLVVVGDSSFASNELLTVPNNQDLFVNSIAWLVDEEDQIGEGPSSDDEGDPLTMTVLGGAMVWLVSVLLVPGSAGGLAVLVLIRRRYL